MQQSVYNFVVASIREHGFSPTIREIQAEFDFRSSNSVVIHLNNLRAKGYITKSSSKEKMRTRTIRLVDDIIGNYTIDTGFLNKALKNLKERGYKIEANVAVELLKELKVNIV
jgi:SOS-response transcriptional repressor LexA